MEQINAALAAGNDLDFCQKYNLHLLLVTDSYF